MSQPQVIYVQGPPPPRSPFGYILAGILVATMSVPLACCGGCFVLTMVAAGTSPGPPLQQTPDPEVSVYTPIRPLACATNPDFLDSSPLVSPANFARVEPGIKLKRIGFGGLTGRMYWKLSAGGRELIYVYRDDFDSKFRQLPSAASGSSAPSP